MKRNLENRKNNFLEKLSKINGDIFELIGEFESTEKETQFKCKKCNNLFNSKPYNTIRRKREGCHECNKNSRNTEERKNIFLNKLRNKYPNKNFIYLDGFNKMDKKCRFKCENCNNENYLITPNSILYKKDSDDFKCNKCKVIHNKQEFEEYLMDIYKKYGEKFTIPLSEKNNFENSYSKINIYCKKCENYFNKKAYIFKSYGSCPYCNMTKLEKRLYDILLNYFNKNDIEVQKGFHNLSFINSQKFDFYIKKENLLIEIDGKQHYLEDSFNNKEEFIKTLKRDKNKDNFARDNNFKFIRLTYLDDLELEINNYINKNKLNDKIFSINI